MVTTGDQFLKDKWQAFGGKGMFVKELEEALLDRRADIAVHSMKDVPATFPTGLSMAAICTRDNPFDALISKAYNSLDNLPVGASIGTTSLRRQSQLLARRPDLTMVSLRGNIQTRLSKLETEGFDAIVLAVAGLERMGLQGMITQILDDNIMLPACAQGALGIECRTDDEEMQQLVARLNDPLSAICVHSERHVNAVLGGNCHAPIAVYCRLEADSQLLLRALVATPDGSTLITDSQRGHQRDALKLADQCAHALHAMGAATLLAAR